MVPTSDVIAIFDLRSKEKSEATEAYLDFVAKKGLIVTIDTDESKSFVITTQKVYYSPISSLTLKKRAGFVTDLEL